LAGLDAGADDYLSKRMSAAHFTARLRTAKRILTLEYSLQSALDSKRQLAMTDALTGIYNRRYFLRHISRELKRVQRFRGDLSLLLFDVDNFKQINDIHGHAGGDDVLKAITRACAACLRRETDWCARLGGDEFAVVLEGTCLTEAAVCARSLLRAISTVSVRVGGRSVKVSVSIGVSGLQALRSRESATVQALMETADSCLYASKRRGRNCVTVADETPSHPSVGFGSEHRGIHDDTKMQVDSFRR
jgi:two-component system cell cycle response regulator